MNNRIRELREARGLSARRLAAMLEPPTSGQQLRRLEDGERQLTESWLRRISAALGVWPADLLADDGKTGGTGGGDFAEAPSVRGHDMAPASQAGERTYTVREFSPQLCVRGGGSMPEPTDARASWGLPVEYVDAELKLDADKIMIVEVITDSMAPKLLAGQRIVVDTSDRTPSPAGIFYLHDGVGPNFMRLAHVPYSDPPKVEMSFDNPAHRQVYERDVNEIEIIGRAVIQAGRL